MTIEIIREGIPEIYRKFGGYMSLVIKAAKAKSYRENNGGVVLLLNHPGLLVAILVLRKK